MNLVHFSSKTFAQAAEIAAKIETLETQLLFFLHAKVSSGKAEHFKASTEAKNLIAKKDRRCSS